MTSRLNAVGVIVSCLLFAVPIAHGEDCLTGADVCTADNSCEMEGQLHCCGAGFLLRASSLNDKLQGCSCTPVSAGKEGFRCTVRGDEENWAARVTSSFWLTCAVAFMTVWMFSTRK